MLYWFTLLLACQWLGEVIVSLVGWPIPGPVLGMVFLLLFLVVRGEEPPGLTAVSDGLLRHLSLLFVPAGVGVVTHAAELRAAWAPILGALVLSTALAILVTGWLMQWLTRGERR